MKNYLLTILMSLVVIIMFAWLPLTQVDAQGTAGNQKINEGLQVISDSFPDTVVTKDGSFTDLVVSVINIALYISGFLTIAFVIYGGYQYITSAGAEDKAKKGRSTMVNALIGLVLIVLSYVIVNTVYKFITEGIGS